MITTTPQDEERRARARERDLAKARRAAQDKREREQREVVREWKAWAAWCRESANAFGALKRARESGDAKAIERARMHDTAVLRNIPHVPRSRKPSVLKSAANGS